MEVLDRLTSLVPSGIVLSAVVSTAEATGGGLADVILQPTVIAGGIGLVGVVFAKAVEYLVNRRKSADTRQQMLLDERDRLIRDMQIEIGELRDELLKAGNRLTEANQTIHEERLAALEFREELIRQAQNNYTKNA